MEGNTLLLLLIVFTLSFLVGSLIYLIGGKISAKSKEKKSEKNIPYACGEKPPPIKEVRINLERFFIFAVYFLIFDVFAFIIAISSSAPWHLPTIYSLVVLMAVFTFLISRRHV